LHFPPLQTGSKTRSRRRRACTATPLSTRASAPATPPTTSTRPSCPRALMSAASFSAAAAAHAPRGGTLTISCQPSSRAFRPRAVATAATTAGLGAAQNGYGGTPHHLVQRGARRLHLGRRQALPPPRCRLMATTPPALARHSLGIPARRTLPAWTLSGTRRGTSRSASPCQSQRQGCRRCGTAFSKDALLPMSCAQ
jgi:hypothetical protein